SCVLIDAPISRNGCATRSIGRFDNDSSPVSVAENCWPAINPANRRMDVPELPISSGCCGAVRPCRPTPCTRTLPSCGPSMRTPMARKAFSVDSASSPSRNPLTSVTPSAIAPSMIDRCEMDLSPGTRTVPVTQPPGCSRNSTVKDTSGNWIGMWGQGAPREVRSLPRTPCQRRDHSCTRTLAAVRLAPLNAARSLVAERQRASAQQFGKVVARLLGSGEGLQKIIAIRPINGGAQILQMGAELIEQRHQCHSIGERNVVPHFWIARGDTREIAKAAGCVLEYFAMGGIAGKRIDQRKRQHMRQMAGRRQHAVVIVHAHSRDIGTGAVPHRLD